MFNVCELLIVRSSTNSTMRFELIVEAGIALEPIIDAEMRKYPGWVIGSMCISTVPMTL